MFRTPAGGTDKTRMITLLRLGRPGMLMGFFCEGTLIFGVLYAMAAATAAIAPGFIGGDAMPTVATASILFLSILISIRAKATSENLSKLREFTIFAIFCWFVALFTYLAARIIGGTPSRMASLLMVEAAVALPLVAVGWRWTSERLHVFSGRKEKLLILGTGETAREACRTIVKNHGNDYFMVGFASENQESIGEVIAMGRRVQTDYSGLGTLTRGKVDRILVALDEKRGKLPIQALMQLRLAGLEIDDATTFFERAAGKISVESLLPSWIIFSGGFKVSRGKAVMKRLTDILFSTLLLIVSAPIMLVTAILVKLDGGPVLYSQKRVGIAGRKFNIYKFRSMVLNAESGSGPTWATTNDPRVTLLGRFIRASRIDELPQLFNIFVGEMSFIGPRPERPHFVSQLADQIPYYTLRLGIRPGLTGWAQVRYRYGSTVEENQEKLKYDLFYIKNASFILDLWIAIQTVRVVLSGMGAR